MALNEAYGQTDVWNDRRWLQATAQGRGRLAKLARERLKELFDREQQERGLEATRANLQESIRARQQAFAETQADRKSRERMDYLQREQRARELGQARADTLAQRQEEAKDRESYRTLIALQYLPMIEKDPKKVEAMSKDIMNRFLSGSGVPVNTATPAPDATTQAAQRAATQLGRQVAPQTGVAPTGTAPQGAGAQTAPATQGTAPTPATAPVGEPMFVPRELFEGEGGPAPFQPREVGGAIHVGYNAASEPQYIGTHAGGAAEAQAADFIRQAKATGQPYMEGGPHNVPASWGVQGMDFNPATSTWVPSDLVGTINGQPAPNVAATSAATLGHTPEDPRALALYNQAAQATKGLVAAGAGRPTMESTPTGQTEVGQQQAYFGKPMGPMSPVELAQRPTPSTVPTSTGAPQVAATPGEGAPPIGAEPPVTTGVTRREDIPALQIYDALGKGLDWMGTNVFRGAREAEERRKQQTAVR